MPDYGFLTDDAVAERLISEANDGSSRRSPAGLESRRARPKPSTRFLRNVIRRTENHNAVLLAKEAAESRARLRELHETELREHRRHPPEPDEMRSGSLAGLESRRTSPENRPKPSTRFLRNVIRRTENHNAALLAKEAAESRARLRQLRKTELRERQRHPPEPDETVRRQMRDISAILHGEKKPTAAPASSSAGGISAGGISGHPLSRRKGDMPDREDHHPRGERRSRQHGSDGRWTKAKRVSRSRERDHGRDRHRHRSSSPDGGQWHRRRSGRERSPLGGGGHKRHDGRQESRHERHTRHSSRSKSPRDYNRKRPADDWTEDSDSLAETIGPLPPSPPTRGRGNTALASGIDARFSESYDPMSDVTHEDLSAEAASSTKCGNRGGWDDMAEAFRDRQKWKAQGAERLRAAGFTETQIQKWERGTVAGRGDGGDAHPDDFCWSKKGELRQWDRGKTVNPDGSVSTGPDWAK